MIAHLHRQEQAQDACQRSTHKVLGVQGQRRDTCKPAAQVGMANA